MKNAIWMMSVLAACTSDQNLKNPEHIVYPPSNAASLEQEFKTDLFLQPTGKPADILFVMDKSCSMVDDATQLNANIPLFFSALDQYNVDYHVGLISTDVVGQPLGELVSWENSLYITPMDDGPYLFSMMNGIAAMQGEGESGIDSIFAAMKLNLAHNKSFFRTLTPLHLIIVSDEEDSSFHHDPTDLYQYLQHWAGERNEKVYLSGVLTLPESTCGIFGGSSVGYRYMTLIDHLQGEAIDICEADWSLVLNDLALLATPNDSQTFYLSQVPAIKTFCMPTAPERDDCIDFHVTHDAVTFSYEQEGMLSYVANENSIKILDGYLPVDGDLISIHYPIE